MIMRLICVSEGVHATSLHEMKDDHKAINLCYVQQGSPSGCEGGT